MVLAVSVSIFGNCGDQRHSTAFPQFLPNSSPHCPPSPTSHVHVIVSYSMEEKRSKTYAFPPVQYMSYTSLKPIAF